MPKPKVKKNKVVATDPFYEVGIYDFLYLIFKERFHISNIKDKPNGK